MTHWDNLSKYLPLVRVPVLDLGSGRGAFLVEATSRGAQVVGLELSEEYIRATHARAEKAGLTVVVKQGKAERLPFANESFDFVNICEVIEHVEDPKAMLNEVYRVLRPHGHAYLSVPNRFGIRDPHFHLYFVNWLPRSWADSFIGLFRHHKDYTDVSAGRQHLSDMHYYRFDPVLHLVRSCGFAVIDIRARRIETEFCGIQRSLLSFIYPLARTIYLDSFHLLLTKEPR